MISADAPGIAVVPEGGFSSPSGRSMRGSHQLAAVEVCERLWWLRYDQGYVLLQDKEHRLHGTLIHLCMAYHYASKMQEPPLWFYEKDLSTALYEKCEGRLKIVDLSKLFLLAYREQYAVDTLVPAFIEDQFLATVADVDPDGVVPGVTDEVDRQIVSCRPDLIARVDGVAGGGPGLYVVDYKTQGRGYGKNEGLEHWNPEGEWSLNWQILVNLRIVRATCNDARRGGLPVVGFIIQRGTRNPDKSGRIHLDRHITNVSPWAYEQAGAIIRRAVTHETELKARIAKGGKPNASLGWSCWGRYGPCDFHPVCRARSRETAAQALEDLYRIESRTP